MKYWLCTLLLTWSFYSASEPFDSCPTEAFLMQGKNATLYGVNLYSGFYRELSTDLNTSQTINGFGFNWFDNYLYGWGYEFGTLVKIGSDYIAQPLTLSGVPDKGFYVGDVALTSNYYYSYRPGASYGLYRVSLDSSHPDYLQMERIIDGSSLNLAIYDLAFHPYQEFAYSVDRNGRLVKINVSDGSYQVLGNTGQSGTFGAVYFDVNANLYFSRNTDGYIYRVDIDAGQTTAEFYTYGPASSNNDGARCALAEVYDPELPPTVDMGDAPESFDKLTPSSSTNYAKHAIGDLFLGTNIDAEYEPRADDSDDGVNFVTTLEIGLDAILSVNSSAEGYLSVWFDWDQNQNFSEDEKVINGHTVSAGQNTIVYNVPYGSPAGQIWVRVRLAQLPDIGPIGGAGVGEVSDYQVEVIDSGVTRVSTGWATVAFEDRWPQEGDYDFNDVIVRYKVTRYLKEGLVKRFNFEGYLQAVGADFRNAFAIRLPGVEHGSFDTALTRFSLNGQAQSQSPIEDRDSLAISNTTDAVIIPFADTKNMYQATNACKYFRTEPGCGSSSQPHFNISLTLAQELSALQAPTDHMDPFIFAVSGYSHGSYVTSGQERHWEVHLKNQQPTVTGTSNLYQLADDNSEGTLTYQNDNGLPWAIMINDTWRHPLERHILNMAYPQFIPFAKKDGNPLLNWTEQKDERYIVED